MKGRLAFPLSSIMCATLVWLAPGDAATTQGLIVVPAQEERSGARLAPSASLSHDGRLMGFESAARLLRADNNDTTDIYVLDHVTRSLELVSRGTAGHAGNGPSLHPSLSGDGRFVAFESLAADLVATDDNDASDVFVYDRQRGSMRLVSASASGGGANGASSHPRLSDDGRFVVFHSTATDIVTGDDVVATPPGYGVYRIDLVTGERINVSDLPTPGAPGSATYPTVSGNGSRVAYVRTTRSGTGSRSSDIWLADLAANTHARVVSARNRALPDGTMRSPTLSGDGRWLAFVSDARNLLPRRLSSPDPQVYVVNLTDGTVAIVSGSARVPGNGPSTSPSIAADGGRILFASVASNLTVGHDTDPDINLVSDVFTWERTTGGLERVTRPVSVLRWLDPSDTPVVSGDGRVVAFLSRQPVSDDDDRETFDLFVIGLPGVAAGVGAQDPAPRPGSAPGSHTTASAILSR